jgi:hypothetical protein
MMTPIIGTNPRKLAWPLTRIVLPSTKTYSHLKWPAINAAAPTKKSSRPVTYVYGTHIDVNASGSMTTTDNAVAAVAHSDARRLPETSLYTRSTTCKVTIDRQITASY